MDSALPPFGAAASAVLADALAPEAPPPAAPLGNESGFAPLTASTGPAFAVLLSGGAASPEAPALPFSPATAMPDAVRLTATWREHTLPPSKSAGAESER